MSVICGFKECLICLVGSPPLPVAYSSFRVPAQATSLDPEKGPSSRNVEWPLTLSVTKTHPFDNQVGCLGSLPVALFTGIAPPPPPVPTLLAAQASATRRVGD